ncbi:MAG TPA: SDR family oxidoreductase, partial [Jatrophihabitans sp.]|nr:SDR family oxidoreductase [Jatrophihabitans sp.]
TGGSYLVADLAEAQAGEWLVEQVLQRHGRLDGVVANAGAGHVGPFAEMPPDDIVRLVELDLRAPMLLARAAAPVLPAGGALVFVGSIAGAVGVPGETVYSACKAGLASFAELLGEELRDRAITVSTVLPGVVDTDFLRSRAEPYDRRFPRPMPAERVARAVLDALTGSRPRRFEPRWLAIPARLAGALPGTYRRLARRFG